MNGIRIFNLTVSYFFFLLQLQDRTQFSDRDLATLKKYWDNGMTSLGSVCREKIEAVAAELNVDCEIVRVRNSEPSPSCCRSKNRTDESS